MVYILQDDGMLQQNLEFKEFQQIIGSKSELMSETTITAAASIQGWEHGHEPDINTYMSTMFTELVLA